MTTAGATMAEHDLGGKHALVIGAGGAAGAAIAEALAEAGADVAVASASLDGDEVMAVRRVRRRVTALGRRSAEYAFDVALGQNVQVSMRQVAKELGGLHIIVYAVDAPLAKPLTQLTEADWQRTLNLNLSGALHTCRAAARELRAGGGHIIIVSGAADEPAPVDAAAYRAARLGVVGLVEAVAPELATAGIGAHLIGPAWLLTGRAVAPAGELPVALGPLAVHLAAGDGASGPPWVALPAPEPAA